MNYLAHLTKPTLSFFLVFSFALSRQAEIVEIGRDIGFTLDAEENKYYEIFIDIPNFESAQFFQSHKDTIDARVSYLEFTRTKISKSIFPMPLLIWTDLLSINLYFNEVVNFSNDLLTNENVRG